MFEHIHTGWWATWWLVAAHLSWPGNRCDGPVQGVCCLQQSQGDQAAHHHCGEDGHPGQVQHVRVDIVGPLPPSCEGYTHLLTMIDRSP